MDEHISVFLSHSSNDKKIATDLKTNLEHYNINLFLAHADISGGDLENWEQILCEKLENCDIFMILLSDQYHIGQYTDQEIGMGMAYNKNIIPISIDQTKPYGFINKIQSTNISKDVNPNDVQNIAELIMTKSKTKITIIDIIIDKFVHSSSWKESGNWTERLLKYDQFSKSQLSKIFTAYICMC